MQAPFDPCPLPLPTPPMFHRYALGEALPKFRCHHHHHAVVLVQISSTSSTALAGLRRRGRCRAVRVLNSEVSNVRYLDRIGSRREYDYDKHDLSIVNAFNLQGYVDTLPSRC